MDNENIEMNQNEEVAEGTVEDSDSNGALGTLILALAFGAAFAIGVGAKSLYDNTIKPAIERRKQKKELKRMSKMQSQQDILDAMRENSCIAGEEGDFED